MPTNVLLPKWGMGMNDGTVVSVSTVPPAAGTRRTWPASASDQVT